MLKRLVAGLAAVLALTLALVGLGFGASNPPIRLIAWLTAKEQVPKPLVPSPTSVGRWTATLKGAKISWKLTYAGLTSKALSAHVHFGVRGRAGGPVLILVCSPCRSGTAGFASLTKFDRKIFLSGRVYVDIHTANNRTGEIRGQARRLG